MDSNWYEKELSEGKDYEVIRLWRDNLNGDLRVEIKKGNKIISAIMLRAQIRQMDSIKEAEQELVNRCLKKKSKHID